MRDQRGAAAVEFALVVPILAMLLIGIFWVALAYNQKLSLSNAVREGARTGATAPSTDPGNWLAAVQGRVTQSTDGLDTDAVCVQLIKTTGGATPTVNVLIDSGCASTPPDDPSGVQAGCFVKVWARQKTHLDWLLGSADPFTRASAVAVYDRNETCS